MLSFIGDYTCKLDAKGRLVVPSVFRKEMQKGGECSLVLRKNIFDDCIDVYLQGEWERLVERLRERISSFNNEHVRFMRAFFRGVMVVEMDGNGRILIPRKMMDEVGVDSEVVMIGLDTKIEIWSVEKYERSVMEKDEFLQLTQKLGL